MPMVDRQASGAGHSERTVIFPVCPCAAGGRCDVPGRPDIRGPGSCFVSLCTSWSKPRLGALGVLKSDVPPPVGGVLQGISVKETDLAFRGSLW